MTAAHLFDLDAYLKRIGFSGTAAPTLDTLKEIQARHPAAITFENLDSLTGRVPSLALADVQRKLVTGGRGGYCFEQNLLLRHALGAIGFRVAGLSARVLWNVPAGPTPPRSHMVLRIDLEGDTYIADVGFGGMTMTAPMRLAATSAQETPHGPYRLAPTEDSHRLDAQIGDQWHPLYVFDQVEQTSTDYEVGNWYVATHPASLFVTTLICARTDTDRRYALRDTDLSIHYTAGSSERHRLDTPEALRDVLEGTFNLNLAGLDDLDARLAAVCAKSSAPWPDPATAA
tara:strand:+ start:282 stop:1142 length:861 start_codon:yes stop_codon:yes gene_type:complete